MKSFVKSCNLDNWTDREVQFMVRGGNQRLRDFMKEYDIKDYFLPNMKYSFQALFYYRKLVKLM